MDSLHVSLLPDIPGNAIAALPTGTRSGKLFMISAPAAT